MRLIIDSNYLSRICRPKRFKDLAQWVTENLTSQKSLVVIIPETIDYEVRRGFLYEIKKKSQGFTESLDRLNKLVALWRLLPVTIEAWHLAANLWAEARRNGYPNANSDRIDIDVIVAAQALTENATVLTTNARHFEPHGVTVHPDPPASS